MEKEPYQDFLCRIAKHVDSLLIEDTSTIGRFRRHLQSFEEQREKHLDYMKGFQETKIDIPSEYKDPGLMLVINPNTKHLPEPKSKEEEYQRYYIILASIHDKVLPEVKRIDKGILQEQTSYLIWNSLNEFYDSEHRRVYIEQALERVKSEILKEKDTDITHPKRRWAWTCIKKIPKWIYILVLFLAALLTIFYYLGWLEPVKEFIDEILAGK